MLGLILMAMLPGTDGRSHDPVKAQGIQVLYFVLAECPIARKYSPEIQRLSKKAKSWIVFEDPDLSLIQARNHLKSFRLNPVGLLDGDHRLSRSFKVTTVPTAVVLRNGKVVYKGRIDDRFPALGIERRPRSFDLRDALVSLAAGKTPRVRETPTIGCAIN
jgi:hypothetical protein